MPGRRRGRGRGQLRASRSPVQEMSAADRVPGTELRPRDGPIRENEDRARLQTDQSTPATASQGGRCPPQAQTGNALLFVN